MDVEIAARNLLDTFRYNVLPEVIQAIGWKKKDLDFEDLPDHEWLLWMVMNLGAPTSLRTHAYYLLVTSTSKTQLRCSVQLYAGGRDLDKFFDGFSLVERI